MTEFKYFVQKSCSSFPVFTIQNHFWKYKSDNWHKKIHFENEKFAIFKTFAQMIGYNRDEKFQMTTVD